MKRLFFVFTAVLLICISCRIDPNLTSSDERPHEGASDWMGQISSDVRLADLSIPGTHDSCANRDFLSLSSTAANQDLSLREQLDAGVRFFDIRPCLEDGQLIIRHGITKQNITFDKVIDIFIEYLKDHASETIIISILPEWKDEGNFENIYSALKHYRDLPEKSEYFLFGNDVSRLTVGECRSKIICVSRSSYLSMDMNDIFSKGYSESGVSWKTDDLEYSWSEFLTLIGNRDGSSNNSLYSVFLSCYMEGQLGIPNIRIASSMLNSRLLSYLENLNADTGKLGIIACDHMTNNLSYLIYSRN